ncbi:spore germination protein [Neobacillus drentensis]|uniref:spore germination protein n=1 Tax=Neobacillus drentensis TaxID=220684 RepID=UPI001F22EE62|nr:spore germination protein [Neobacillus drentensis]ULT59535.1 spore germination protein [Neobacillus drentensis]
MKSIFPSLKKFMQRDIQPVASNEDSISFKEVFHTIDENISYLKHIFSDSADLKTKEFNEENNRGILVFLDTMADKDKIQRDIIKPLMEAADGQFENVLHSIFLKSNNLIKAQEALLNGSCIMFLNGVNELYMVEIGLSKDRSIIEPSNEQVIQGSHEGFIENLSTNLHLIRKSCRTANLTMEHITLGEHVQSKLSMVYMKDLANPEMISEFRRRVNHISMDHLPGTGALQELIEDSTWSPFPQILNTERVDRVIGHLNEGRVAVLMEGYPACLIIPVTFFAFFHSPDDYNSRWMIGTFIRSMRLVSIIIAVNLPAIYIAVIGFHFEVLPDDLVLPIVSSIKNIPFPPLIEALVMELTIELIREAGVRLPSRIGQTIGIVGGLVIGDAVVRAGLISNTMIVVVAITAIAAYSIPATEMSDAVRFLRFPHMILASTFGFVGIIFGFMFTLAHLCRLESFGTAYFSPWAPFRLKDIKDTFIRLPLWKFNTRPNDSKPKILKKQSLARGWESNEKKQE